MDGKDDGIAGKAAGEGHRDAGTDDDWLDAAVVAVLAAALLAGVFLPVYTDVIGWRFQERAGFDGSFDLRRDDGDHPLLFLRLPPISAEVVPGWASTVLPMLFLGGVQLLSIGVLGEYIGKYLHGDEAASPVHRRGGDLAGSGCCCRASGS